MSKLRKHTGYKEVVINTCFGGFGLSPLACRLYRKIARRLRTEIGDISYSSRFLKRDDPALIRTVKALGTKSFGECARLAIVKVPKDKTWEVEEYDGSENIRIFK